MLHVASDSNPSSTNPESSNAMEAEKNILPVGDFIKEESDESLTRVSSMEDMCVSDLDFAINQMTEEMFSDKDQYVNVTPSNKASTSSIHSNSSGQKVRRGKSARDKSSLLVRSASLECDSDSSRDDKVTRSVTLFSPLMLFTISKSFHFIYMTYID